MKKGQGKNKGGGYEREVGVKLSLWLSHGQRKDLICRTVGSGAQFTTAAKKLISAGHAGDLMSQDPLSYEFFNRYVCECKFWKDLQMFQFMNEKGELYKALQKVKKEAINVNKKWWLIAKQNHQPDLLLSSTDRDPLTNLRSHSLLSRTVTVYYLDEFLITITPEEYLTV